MSRLDSIILAVGLEISVNQITDYGRGNQKAGVPSPELSNGGTAMSSRLSMPRRDSEHAAFLPSNKALKAGITPLRAFEYLASASCYVSLAPAADPEAALEAVQILHDCSNEVLEQPDILEGKPANLEDQIWRHAEQKWNRFFQISNQAQPAPAKPATFWTRLAGKALEKSVGITGQELLPNAKGLIRCKQCNEFSLRRIERHGFMQTTILPKLGIYPWECAHCRKIFLIHQRYRAGRRQAIAYQPF